MHNYVWLYVWGGVRDIQQKSLRRYEGTKVACSLVLEATIKSVVDDAAKEDKRKLLEVKKRQKLDLLAEKWERSLMAEAEKFQKVNVEVSRLKWLRQKRKGMDNVTVSQ
jgi:hypothetical protein